MSLRSSMVNQRLRKPSVCWGSREPLVGPRQALPLLPVPPPSGRGRQHVHSPSARARGAPSGLWDHLGPGSRVPRVCPHPPRGRDLGVHRDTLGGWGQGRRQGSQLAGAGPRAPSQWSPRSRKALGVGGGRKCHWLALLTRPPPPPGIRPQSEAWASGVPGQTHLGPRLLHVAFLKVVPGQLRHQLGQNHLGWALGAPPQLPPPLPPFSPLALPAKLKHPGIKQVCRGLRPVSSGGSRGGRGPRGPWVGSQSRPSLGHTSPDPGQR